MPKFILKFINDFDGHTQELISGATVAFALKIIAGGMAFLLNVLIARLLGVDGSGVFFLAMTIVIVLSGIGTLGTEQSLVRFIAANDFVNRHEKVLGVYKKANLYSFITAASFSIVLYVISPWLSQSVFSKPELADPLRYMSLAILPMTLLSLHASALQGLKKIAASISVQSIFVPLIAGIISLLFIPIFGMNAAVVGYSIAAVITSVIGFYFWKKAVLPWKTCQPEFDTKELLDSSIPLLAVNIMNFIIIWSPMIFLGVWSSNENIGIYSAASRTAMLISFILVAVNSIAVPKFSALYQQREMKQLTSIVHTSTKMMLLVASPLLFVFLLFPEWILLLFGEKFKEGAMVLSILAIGQTVNVAGGSAGALLMISGNEKILRNILLFNTFVGIILYIVLIQNFGAIGAAISFSILISLVKVICVYWVWEKLNIMTIPWLVK
ncbi:MAG: O-antigen/teichoic acid export membrane protein [Patiriisocius sp.]|jgi:O-antigen/teichoic acid export membrane protein